MLVVRFGSHSQAEVTRGLPFPQNEEQQVEADDSALSPSTLIFSLLQQLQSLYAHVFTLQAKSFILISFQI